MNIFNDPGNLTALGIILALAFYFWWLARKTKGLPVPAPEPIPAPDGSIDYEDYYNNKYPKVDILYDGRKVPWRQGRYNIDVRNFFNRYDSQVRKIVDTIIFNKDITDNNKALLCLCWVIDHVNYASDVNADGSQTEYWNFAFETLLPRSPDSPRLFGDCEDMAILLANLIMASGVPYWKVRISAGDVDDGRGNAGGHCFVTFFDETRAIWVLLDACYYANKFSVEQRKDYKQESFYKSTWFSWSECYCWAKDVRDVGKMNGVNANG